MLSLDQWLQHAPEPPELTAGHRWHVFLSYRSVNRPWVLKLYDVLRSLDYEVFMDQYVLPAGVNLIGALEEHLEQSASGVLVWSTDNADSAWCKKEQRTFQHLSLHRTGSPFHYVAAKLDSSELPLFDEQTLWIDFSGAEFGPTGEGLLRLLYGLRGEALPPAAVAFATEVDQKIREAEAKIQAAVNAGRADQLVALPASGGVAWETGPSLAYRAAEGLVKLAAYREALELLAQLEADFPRSLRLRQLKGLALARSGDWQGAQLVLEELHAQGEQDPETLGILARTWMDRYEESEDPLHLRRSRDLYAEAFTHNPTDYYCGINAASKSVFLGDAEAARQHADGVAALVGTDPTADDYWRNATMAEAQLLLGNCSEAAGLYAAALATAPQERGSHRSTWRQAKRLLEHRCSSPQDAAAIRKVFQHLED